MDTINDSFLDKVCKICVVISVAFVPFQSALTFNISGNPFKISEIFLLIAILVYPFTHYMRRKTVGQAIIGVFLVIILASATINLLFPGQETRGKLYGFSLSPESDLIFYTVFSVFSITAWKIVSVIGRENIIRGLLIAGTLCFIATFLQYISVSTGQTGIIEALGFSIEGRGSGSVSTRNGPFVEGQHLGFFAGAIFIIAVAKRKWILAAGLLWTIYYSQSTTAVLGILLVFIVLLIIYLNIYTLIMLLASATAAYLSFVFSETFRNYVFFQLSKLGFPVAGEMSGNTVSLNLRNLKSEIGFNIMANNPVLGVGPGRYSIYYYYDSLAANSPTYYFHSDHRAIAENVYAQIGAELGIIGLLVFISLLIYIFMVALKNKNILGASLVVFVGVGISTQSMMTFLPIWVLLAATTQLEMMKEDKNENYACS